MAVNIPNDVKEVLDRGGGWVQLLQWQRYRSDATDRHWTHGDMVGQIPQDEVVCCLDSDGESDVLTVHHSDEASGRREGHRDTGLSFRLLLTGLVRS